MYLCLRYVFYIIGLAGSPAQLCGIHLLAILFEFTVECVRVHLSPLLLSIYVDDLISELRQSGYGLHIGGLFIGLILYADDIALLACSCYGLQQLINACNKYGMQWDIRFNPQKTQLACFGGNSSRDNIITLGYVSLCWSAQIKYLGCCHGLHGSASSCKSQ